MTILSQLQTDMKEAMKRNDKERLSTIRLILALIQSKRQEKKDLALKKKATVEDLTEEEVVAAIQTFKKQNEEEREAFARSGNELRVAVLDRGLEIITQYLPKQLEPDEVKYIIVQEAILLQNHGTLNKGTLMKAVMPILKGKTSNQFIAIIVDEVLK